MNRRQRERVTKRRRAFAAMMRGKGLTPEQKRVVGEIRKRKRDDPEEGTS